MHIRRVTQSDTEAVSTLIIAAAQECRDDDFSDIGWARFLQQNNLQETRHRIVCPECISLCGELNNEIIGIITVKANQKIDQLFVSPKHRHKGVANSLWGAIKPICDEQNPKCYYWVRASTIAIPVYIKFGFQIMGEPKTENGIKYTPLSTTGD